MNCTSLPALLRLPSLCHLESFSIAVCRELWVRWNWNNFNNEMKEALLNIIHSSTLKTLSLTGLTDVPITFFFHIVHLTTLELKFLLPNDFVDENSSSLTRAASMGVALMVSHTAPMIDRCVWRFRAFDAEYGIPFICVFPIGTDSGQTRYH